MRPSLLIVSLCLLVSLYSPIVSYTIYSKPVVMHSPQFASAIVYIKVKRHPIVMHPLKFTFTTHIYNERLHLALKNCQQAL